MASHDPGKGIKVALISFDFGEYCIQLASALAQDAEVLLLLSHQIAAPYLSKLYQAVRFQPFHHPRLSQPLRQLATIYRIFQRIRVFDPDLIHLQKGHLWFNLALPLLRRYPLVLTIHDPRYHIGDRESQKIPRVIMDLGRYRADQIIVHGTLLKQVVVGELGLRSDIVHVIPMIALGNAMVHSQVEEDDHQILFFGRIWEYKGLEYLIRAEPLVTAQVPDARIVIAGQGEDFTRYRRLMVHSERFTVHNEYISDAKCAELFQRASVVALPYIDASQSAVIPVAYTFGKPVVATTVGGLPELVDHGRTGYLVPPRDEQALADALVRLLRDRELRQQMGANGKRKVETDLSPDTVARQTLAVYRQAISDRLARAQRRQRISP
jgi:glycosyltransferase involved in cell wall biosynthesis